MSTRYGDSINEFGTQLIGDLAQVTFSMGTQVCRDLDPVQHGRFAFAGHSRPSLAPLTPDCYRLPCLNAAQSYADAAFSGRVVIPVLCARKLAHRAGSGIALTLCGL
jgi:hypothetical protein